MARRVAILGSTGFIGTMALEVIAANPEEFTVVALAAGTNTPLLLEQMERFSPSLISVRDENDALEFVRRLGQRVEIACGDDGLLQTATHPDADIILTAVVGSRGLAPTLAAIEAGKDIALANKETLVAGGDLVMAAAKRRGVKILPVDSEHSALYQCLSGRSSDTVERLILTASGGSFRHLSRQELSNVTVKDALAHPTWRMGKKITIDSATLMNKGLEVIEARYLFGQTYDRIDVALHPESVVHSMVEFCDGSLIAQLGAADMRIPIQWAMAHPNVLDTTWKRFDFSTGVALHFAAPDMIRYPCLRLAYEAGRQGGVTPAVLNAANEAAVEMFLCERISFLDIERMVETALHAHITMQHPTLDDIFAADAWARDYVHRLTIE